MAVIIWTQRKLLPHIPAWSHLWCWKRSYCYITKQPGEYADMLTWVWLSAKSVTKAFHSSLMIPLSYMAFEHPLQEQNRRKVIQLQRDMQPHKSSSRITKAITTIIEKAFMSALLFIGQCITITTIGWQSYLLVHIVTVAPSFIRQCFYCGWSGSLYKAAVALWEVIPTSGGTFTARLPRPVCGSLLFYFVFLTWSLQGEIPILLDDVQKRMLRFR